MGCGASQNKTEKEPKREEDRKSREQPRTPKEAYVDDGPHDTVEDGDDHPVVTAAVMAELRTRSRDLHTGSTVQRWIESIAEPVEADSADVYDPLRRHLLSMESLHNRLNQEG